MMKTWIILCLPLLAIVAGGIGFYAGRKGAPPAGAAAPGAAVVAEAPAAKGADGVTQSSSPQYQVEHGVVVAPPAGAASGLTTQRSEKGTYTAEAACVVTPVAGEAKGNDSPRTDGAGAPRP